MFLNGTTHGAGAVLRIVTFLHEELASGLVEHEFDLFVTKAGEHLADFEIDDAGEFGLVQHVEDDDIIQAIEELGFEEFFGVFANFALHAIVIGGVLGHGTETEGGLAFDGFGSDVGGEDDDGIAEVDLASEVVGDLALFEDLKEEVHDIRVGFFDFVEEHDGVGAAADGFGELAAFFITDVSGRGSDEAAGGVFLHVFGHVELDQGVSAAEHEFGEVFCQEGFADTGGAEEEEGADRATWVLEIGARAAEGFRDGDDGFVLADDAALEFGLHFEEFLGFGLFHALKGNAGPFGDDGHDFVLVDVDGFFLAGVTPRLEKAIEAFFGLLFLVAKVGGFFEVLLADGFFFFDPDGFDFFLDALEFGRAGHGSDAGFGAGFVHDVDGLVR